VPAGGWPYELQATVPGRISVVASAEPGHYDTGDPIDIKADVAIAGTPVADATVDATVTKPDGTGATVALVGDGSGTYTGSFGDSSACGMYQVLVTASGTDGSTPFTRQDRTLAVVGVPGNAILNPCNADSDGDGLTDEEEITTYSTNPAAADTDSDGFFDGGVDVDGPGPGRANDNCPPVSNPGQENTDAAIDNGPGIPGDDTTVPNAVADSEGDACESDGDADNDGLPDSQDTNPLTGAGLCGALTANDGHPNPAGGDVTNDDNHNGDPALAMGTDASDNGPSWDTDNDGALDGVECTLSHNPRSGADRPSTADCGGTGDADGDGLQDAWETCGWGTDLNVVDSDGDTHGDCKEAADVNGDGLMNFVGDTIYYAKAALLPPASFGKTMDFDIDKNGTVDFVGDVIQEAKFALIAGLCK